LLASQWLSSECITEIIYQPTGPDIPGELEAFYAAARTTVIPAAQGD
jgi:5,10-methylenetetrahydromethanopterin reductase